MPGDVERTALDAIAAADAVLADEVDDAVGVLHDRAGAGHAFRQPGSSQCMQPSLRISHSRLPFSSSHSVKRIRVQVLGVEILGIVVGSLEIPDLRPKVVPFHAGGLARLAADAAADIDQLRHLLLVIADRRRRQGRCRPANVVLGLQISHRLLFQASRGAGLLDIDQERLELRRLRIGIADGRGQRVGAVALARLAGEAPMDRHADHMRGLAVHRQRADALGHIGLADDHATLGGQTHPAALLDPLLLRQDLADLDELLRLQDRVDQRVLGPEVEMLGQPVGGRDVRESPPRCRRPPGRWRTPAPPGSTGPSDAGRSAPAIRTARNVPGTGLPPSGRGQTGARHPRRS